MPSHRLLHFTSSSQPCEIEHVRCYIRQRVETWRFVYNRMHGTGRQHRAHFPEAAGSSGTLLGDRKASSTLIIACTPHSLSMEVWERVFEYAFIRLQQTCSLRFSNSGAASVQWAPAMALSVTEHDSDSLYVLACNLVGKGLGQRTMQAGMSFFVSVAVVPARVTVCTWLPSLSNSILPPECLHTRLFRLPRPLVD